MYIININSFIKSVFISFVVVCLFTPGNTSAQKLERDWYRMLDSTFSGQGFYDVAVDSEGYIYATGVGYDMANPNSNEDYFTVKLNPNTGDTLWKSMYHTDTTFARQYARQVITDSFNNIYVSGFCYIGIQNNESRYDILTLKYNSQGQLLWAVRSGSNFIVGVHATQMGYFAMRLTHSGEICIAADRNVLKYSSSGQFLWGDSISSARAETIHSLAIDSEDNMIVGGIHYTRKYSPAGALLWSIPVQGYGGCQILTYPPGLPSVVLDAENNIYLAGNTCVSMNGEQGYFRVIRKISPSGSVLWTYTVDMGVSSYTGSNSLIRDSLGNLYCGGYPNFMKFSGSGSLQFTVHKNANIIGLFGSNSLITFGINSTTLREFNPSTGALIDTAEFLLDNPPNAYRAAIIHNNKVISVGYGPTLAYLLTVTSHSKQFVPRQPVTFSVSFIPDSLRFNFEDASIIETGFRIQRSSNSGASWNNVTILPAYNISYPFRVIKSVHNSAGGSGNLFRISAFNNDGSSDWVANNGAKYPSKPLNMSAQYIPGNKVDIKWKSYSRIAAGFKIERRSLTDTVFQQIGQTSDSIRTFTDTQLPAPVPGAKYFYRIRSFTGSLHSDYSDTSTIVLDIPLAPDSLKVNVPQLGTARLRWIPRSSNQFGYVIERSIGTSDNFSVRDTIDATDSSFTDTGLSAGTTYWYRMYAYNLFGNSPYSDSVFVLITNNPNGNNNIPDNFALYQNYPNPFNPVTKIKFDIPKLSEVRIKIYDMLGREIAFLMNEMKQPGRYEINWDAGSFSSGVYFYKLEAGDFTNIKRLVLLK